MFIEILRHVIRRDVSFPSCIEFVFIDSQPSAELESLCASLNVRIIFEDLSVYPRRERGRIASDSVLELLKAHDVDYLFILCDKILSGELLTEYENRIVNTHPSVLPSFKGIKAIDQAIAARAFLLGLTVHFIDEHLDSGVPILQSIQHHSFFKGDYMNILNDAIPAILQVMHWISEDRLSICDGFAKVEGATYQSGRFIPALEIPDLKSLVAENH